VIVLLPSVPEPSAWTVKKKSARSVRTRTNRIRKRNIVIKEPEGLSPVPCFLVDVVENAAMSICCPPQEFVVNPWFSGGIYKPGSGNSQRGAGVPSEKALRWDKRNAEKNDGIPGKTERVIVESHYSI
jgi:hypothetical protein